MPWSAIDSFRKLAGSGKKILGGLVSAGIREIVHNVPVVGSAIRLVHELADNGVDRLVDPSADIPDVKAPGEVYGDDQLEVINQWMSGITESMSDLRAKMEQVVDAQDDRTWLQVENDVRKALLEHSELAEEFRKSEEHLRQQTLSLHRIEIGLSEQFHLQHGMKQSLEELKGYLVDSPMMSEWSTFRKADPKLVELVAEADQHILAGRREHGEKILFDLLRQRGIDTKVVGRHFAGKLFAEGKIDTARNVLTQAGVSPEGGGLGTRLVSHLSTDRSRPTGSSWACLPRGFTINRRYKIEKEVGRGGMSSVYRALGVDRVSRGKVVAIKVPAPNLLTDSFIDRFIAEIQTSQRLSLGRHPAIVETINYEVFEEPHSKQEMYGLVMEFIEGESLAHFLGRRQMENAGLTNDEVLALMLPICQALEYAHSTKPPVLHRDIKPQNIMMTPEGRTKLMDFGIARIMDGSDGLTRGGIVGTPAYMPPELFTSGATIDERVDVYMMGNLLQELLTFSPFGELDESLGHPSAWINLISDSMSRIRAKRPASIKIFRERLQMQPGTAERDTKVAVPIENPPHDLAKPLQVPPPLPPKPIDGQALVVAQAGGGDFRTINEAISRAATGSEIRIRPGLYKEAIVLDRKLILRGEGTREKIVIENDEGAAVTIKADGAEIRGLTVRCTAVQASKKHHGVDIASGASVVEDCDVSSESLSALSIHGPGTNPVIRGCKIHASKEGDGVFIYDRAKGIVENCDISFNKLSGVEIKQDSDPIIRNCKIHSSSDGSGILVHERGVGTILNCDIHSNKLAGINIRHKGNPVIRGCSLHDSREGNGFLVHEQGAGVIENCEIYSNKLAGVEIRENGNPTVRACKIHKSIEGSGIYVYDQGLGVFENCEVFANKLSGVAIKKSANPTLRDCKVHSSKEGDGVLIYEQGMGLIENCDIYANYLSGVGIRQGSNPTIRGCKLHDNKEGDGVLGSDHGIGLVENCDIYSNKLTGVEIRESANPTVRNCKVYKNGYTAVRVHKLGMGTIVDCDLRGNTKESFDIEAGCKVVQRNNKVS
jgi:parallel beta-helix repeat protein